MNRLWIICTVALLVLTGCGSAPASQDSHQPASTASSGSKIVESICKDSTSNGAQEIDLKQVRLQSDGAELLVEYTLSAPLPTADDILLFIMARSPDYKIRYQLGTEFRDGTESAQFIYDLNSSTPKKITPATVVTNQTVTAHFPLDDLKGLGTGFEWDARVSVNGGGGDRCPAGETPQWNIHGN